MELPSGASGDAQVRLKDLRNSLLTLHKALLDSERTSYELVHGPIASPAAFLQLLIHDSWFSWLRAITTLLVQIDEALAATSPPKDDHELELLIEDTRALLSPSREENEFWKRYSAVLARDPAVSVLHAEMESQWPKVSGRHR